MTYTKLYPKLIQCDLLESVSIQPIRPPYPRWYKENASCDYHSGNRGHSLENYTTLKWRVNDFIKTRALTFEDEDVPNVNGNPLPNHQGSKINAVEGSLDLRIERDVGAVYMPMKVVYEALDKAKMLGKKQEEKQ